MSDPLDWVHVEARGFERWDANWRRRGFDGLADRMATQAKELRSLIAEVEALRAYPDVEMTDQGWDVGDFLLKYEAWRQRVQKVQGERG